MNFEVLDKQIKEYEATHKTMSLEGGLNMYAFLGKRFKSDIPPTGRKVRFLNKNGYDGDREYANKYFKEGQILTVKEIYVGRSSSEVEFEEFHDRRFNTVMFEDVRLKKNNIERAIENFKKRNNGLKNNPVCQDVPERVNKQNYEIERNNLAIAALEKQLNGGWISASDRLPEMCGQDILLTIENIFQQRKVIHGFTGYMEKGKLEFNSLDNETNFKNWTVIAWQPLPEPYKEVENG